MNQRILRASALAPSLSLSLALATVACGPPTPLPDGSGGDAATDDVAADARDATDGDVGGGDDGVLFPEIVTNGHHANLAIDAADAVHLVYAATTSFEGVTPVRYGYCPARCAEAASWSFATIGDVGIAAGEPRLELDRAGRPRVVYYHAADLGDGEYRYAACDADCTRAANWRQTGLTRGASPARSRYFALDPDGSPSFVYTDTTEGHRAAYWAFCADGCTSAANWHEVAIGSYLLADFALAYTPQGGARLAFRQDDALAWRECDAGCAEPSAWRGEPLFALGVDGAFALRLDAQGRPRLALYAGYLGADATGSDLLSFAACEQGCASAANWSGRTLGLPARHGAEGLDLALDAQGRPRVAFYADVEPYGLGYARCDDGACAAEGASWTLATVDGSDAVQRANPVPLEQGCSLSVWFAGMRPALALDAQGRPRFAYDAEHVQGGACRVHTDVALVRFATAGAP